MNWFNLVSSLISAGKTIADNTVKNADSVKTKNTIEMDVDVFLRLVEGLINQNPDGTPASVSYAGPTVSVKQKEN